MDHQSNPQAPVSGIQSREELKAKLDQLNAALYEDGPALSDDEKIKHLEMLQQVLNSVQSTMDRKKKGGDDTRILSVPWPRLLTEREILDNFARVGIKGNDICVKRIFYELNWNPETNRVFDEYFVEFDTAEQASMLERISGKSTMGFHGPKFSFPKQNSATRATYRKIGKLIARLREVDGELKKIGAVPDANGFPILPSSFMQDKEFDKYVNDSLKLGPVDSKSLHCFLCHRTKVDLVKRNAALKPLVKERVEILVKLCSCSQDEFPFTFNRKFVV